MSSTGSFPDIIWGLVAVTIGREEAREAAERELSKAIYHRNDPSLITQGIMKLVEWINDFLARAAQMAPGGWPGLLAALGIIVLVAIAIRLRIGQIGRSRAAGEPLLTGRARAAEEHRIEAERHAAAGSWGEAVRERLRAIARALEERAIVQPRLGRTAHELAAEAGHLLPSYAGELQAATRLFDDVWYGGRTATPEMYAQLRQLDEQLSATRPALAESTQ